MQTEAKPFDRTLRNPAVRLHQALDRVVDIYGRVRAYHLSSTKAGQLMTDHLYTTPIFDRLPRYYQERVRGYDQAMGDEIQRHCVVYQGWSLSYENWVFMDSVRGHDIVEAHFSGEGRFVWRDKPDKVWF